MLRIRFFWLSLCLFAGCVIPVWGQAKSSVSYDREKTSSVPNSARPAGKVRKKAVPAKTASLALNWRVIRNTADGPCATNPFQTFHVGDQVQIEVISQVSGYLYVFRESEATDERLTSSPVLVYPDSRIGLGNNVIKPGEPIKLPVWCGPSSQNNCWVTLTPPSGVEKFTVILTRSLMPQFLEDRWDQDSASLLRYKTQFQGTRKSQSFFDRQGTVDRNELAMRYLVQVVGRAQAAELCESIDIRFSTENGLGNH